MATVEKILAEPISAERRTRASGSALGHVRPSAKTARKLPSPLPIAKLQRILGRIGKVRETELIRGFRAWARKNFVPADD